MNIISYFVLGAAVGSLLAAKKIGNKALIFGGLCAILPSLDHLIALLYDEPDSLFINGGVSHSIVFCVLVAPMLGWLLHKFITTELSIIQWSKLAFLTMMSHCAFDVLKIRGYGLLEPFIHKRFALSIIADNDILISTSLLLAFIFAMILKDNKQKAMISWFGMFLLVVLVSFTFLNKLSVQSEFEQRLNDQDVRYSRAELFPVSGALFLWNCVAQDRDGFWMCYQSNLSTNNFEYCLSLRNDYYLFEQEKNPKIKRLKAYTRYFYAIEPKTENSVVLHDLRYARRGFKQKDPYVSSYLIEQKGKDCTIEIVK